MQLLGTWDMQMSQFSLYASTRKVKMQLFFLITRLFNSFGMANRYDLIAIKFTVLLVLQP